MINTSDSSPHEVEVLRTVQQDSRGGPGCTMIPGIRDQFDIQGPNGSHRCLVTSPAQSSVVAAKFSPVFQVDVVRSLAAQLILAVSRIHAQGLVYGDKLILWRFERSTADEQIVDIHLGNALIRLPTSFDHLCVHELYQRFGKPYKEPVLCTDGLPLAPGVPHHGVVPIWLRKKANEIPLDEAHLLLSDFGEAFCPEESQGTRLGNQCRAPIAVLPPEACFEPDKPLSFPADIWALACAAWSILGPRPLFDATLATQDDNSCQQVDILGPLPYDWWAGWDARQEYFEPSGAARDGRFIYPSLERFLEQDLQVARRKSRVSELDEDEARAFINMFRPMLTFRLEERASAKAVLSSEWMATWGLPAVRRACEVNDVKVY